MAKSFAKPLAQNRREYAVHQNRAELFGISPLEFNERVRARFQGRGTYPEAWVTNAYLEITQIAGRKCCPKAEVVSCYCEVRYKCPDHGDNCHGSHD